MQLRIKNDVKDFLIEQVLSSVSNAESPVQGEGWPKLSKGYKKKKVDDGLSGIANMELEGDMLDALDGEATKVGVDIGFYGEEAWKADGHLKFSGKDNGTPKRRFLPGEGQEFKPGIQTEIEKIISDAVANELEFTESDFESVTTKVELYDALGDYFPDLSRSAIRNLITTSPGLAASLESFGLLELL